MVPLGWALKHANIIKFGDVRMVFRDFFNGGGKIEQDLGKIEKIQFELMCLITIKNNL